jgi:hypothetical protein
VGKAVEEEDGGRGVGGRKGAEFLLHHTTCVGGIPVPTNRPLSLEPFLQQCGLLIGKLVHIGVLQHSQQLRALGKVWDSDGTLKRLTDPGQIQDIVVQTTCSNDQQLMGRLSDLQGGGVKVHCVGDRVSSHSQ